jgi:hypothetical protein
LLTRHSQLARTEIGRFTPAARRSDGFSARTGTTSARSGRGESFGEFGRLAEASTVLHPADLVVRDPENLIALIVGGGAPWAPHQPHHHRGADRRNDLRVGSYGRLHPALALLEDRPGLIGAVSSGGVAPPEMAPLDAPPVELRIEEADQRIEVARGGGVKGGLDLCWPDRHAATVALPEVSGE